MLAIGSIIRRVATLLLICGLAACSHSDFVAEPTMVKGLGTIGVANSAAPVKGIIVYFHGADQKAEVVWGNDKQRTFFSTLLHHGYAVVSADAGGNAFGNPASREDYRQLITAAVAKYSAQPVLFIAESMGALAALALLTEPPYQKVKGMVGISPLMGIPAQFRTVSFVENAWGGQVPNSADPLSWPPNVFAGKHFQLYSASQDNVIPAGASARDFAARFGGVASIDLVECSGEHVSSDCYRADDVLQWLNSLG